MGPLVAVVNSSLLRAAELIEKGRSPAKALRQVAQELALFEEVNSKRAVPSEIFKLGEDQRPVVRVL